VRFPVQYGVLEEPDLSARAPAAKPLQRESGMLASNFIAAMFLLSACSAVHAADSCKSGEKKLATGEPCIPEYLFNYLYCLKQSNNGKVEVVEKSDVSGGKELEINVAGGASGVVIKGQASGGYKTSDTHRAVQELSEKIDPHLAEYCVQMKNPPEGPQGSQAPQGYSLRTVVGLNVSLGANRSDVQEALSGASWNSDAGGSPYAVAAAQYHGIRGTLRVKFASDRVSGALFSASITGANVTEFSGSERLGWDERRSTQNGEAFNYSTAKQACSEIRAARSMFAQDFGATARPPDSSSFDPTTSFNKAKRVRLASGTAWTGEFAAKKARVSAEYNVSDRDLDVFNNLTSMTTWQVYSCSVKLTFEPA
jgi:hypothetical protein